MKKKEEIDYSIYNQNIERCDTGEYLKDIVTKYGINVSVFRACSMIIDGLTPGQRRRLYTFYIKGAFPDKPYVKVDDLLGPVAGLHPHGKQSIEKTFINDIKSWESNVLLYDTSGNTGSLIGGKIGRASATRYLSSRLSKYAMKCFFDEFDPAICEMVPSATRQQLEPVVIPSRYPHFLLSLSTGIAWGNAISVPPFNLIEVFKLTEALIKNPKMEGVYLYPDSPRGYDIIENDDILSICESGNGTLKIQARMEYYEENGMRYIDVSGFPDQTDLDKIMTQINKMILDKQISGIERTYDKTQLTNVHFWIILKKDANPEIIKDILYRKTQLRNYLDIRFNFAGRTAMQPLGLKDSLLVWIDYRVDMKQKIYIKKLSKIKERIHVVKGALILLDVKNLNKTIDIIKDSEDDPEAIENLVNAYKDEMITSYQAKEIVDMKLSRINRSNRKKYEAELEQLQKDEIDTQKILSSRDNIKNIIIDELEEGIKLFGKPRACRIISQDALKSPEHYYNIIVTKKYIKKVSTITKAIGTVESDDEVIAVFSNVPESAYVYLVDTLGKTYGVAIRKLHPNDLSSKGNDLKAFCGLKGEVIRAFKPDEDLVDDSFLIMFTESGIIKKTPLKQYITNRTELQGMLLNKDDTVCYAVVYSPIEKESSQALVYTTNGYGISIDLMEGITTTDRLTKGGQYLKLDDNDSIAGVCIVSDSVTDENIFVITKKGYGKVCGLDDIFKTSKRRADMIRLTSLHDGDTVFKIDRIDNLNNTKYTCYSQSGQKVNIDIKDLPVSTRLSKGTKLVPVKRGDAIFKIKKII